MKTLLILMAALALVAARKYTTKYDNLDMDNLVQSPEYMKMSAGCYLDRNPCNKVSAALKKKIPDIVLRACESCTEAQKYILRRYLMELKRQLPQDYVAFRNKYDPNNLYFDSLETAISKQLTINNA